MPQATGEQDDWTPKSPLASGSSPVNDEADPEPEFRPQQTPPPVQITGKVFGKKAFGHDSKLPPMENTASITVPTGEPDAEAVKKAVNTPPPIPVDKKIIEEAEAKAKDIITQAQAKCNGFLNQANMQIQKAQQAAKVQAEEAKKQAFAQGLEEGREEGRKQGKQEFVGLMLQARDLYEQAIRERSKILQASEPELARLSVGIAEKIIGLEVRSGGDVVMGVVRESLAGMKDREQVTIRVSPDDYHIVNADRSSLIRMVEGLKDFELTIDSKVAPGGCIIETNLGNIDARLETQLSAIRSAFEQVSNGVEDGDGDEPG